jgi:hypothetical protein
MQLVRVLTAIVSVAIAGLVNFREIACLWRVSRLEKWTGKSPTGCGSW